MDHEPFDNDLFDPPPKQHKQQTATTASTTTAATAYISAAKNASGHTNLSGGLSRIEIRASKTADAASAANSRSRSPYGDFQYSPKNLTAVSNIVQSGSYVEILKQHSADISPTHPANQKRHHQRAIAACHNKSYGDFLTITPRRKGNKLVPATSGYEQQLNDAGDSLDSYHHRIEPLHLLGLSNEKNYTFLDYRAMEAISNADTLEMGTSLAAGNSGRTNKTRDRYTNEHNNSSNNGGSINMTKKQQKHPSIAEVSTEYQYFLREKSLSPPSAFSDNISAIKKN